MTNHSLSKYEQLCLSCSLPDCQQESPDCPWPEEEKPKKKIAEYQLRYRQANKKKVAKYQHWYYQANKEKVAERNRRCYQANQEKAIEYQRWYRQIKRSAA